MYALRKIVCLLAIVSTSTLLIILFTPVSEFGHRLLRSDDQPIPADVIVILSSSMPYRNPKGLPGQSTMYRLDKGFELYREGFAETIVAFGGIEMGEARKTTGEWMAERLVEYGVPEKSVFVADDKKGSDNYYHNLIDLVEGRYWDFDFTKALFVTTVDQSYRIRRILETRIAKPTIIVAEPYGLYPDWGRRFQHFRVFINELYGISKFYFLGRFDKVVVEN